MKYLLLVGDGMADHPHPALGNRTPLQAARTPNLDLLAHNGTLGTTHTLVTGLPLGSDVANLAVLGYDPRQYYSGRAPLEAANIGVELGPTDVAFRCNLVYVKDGNMADYSSGHISTEDAKPLIKMLGERLGDKRIAFYLGTSYRHLVVWRSGPAEARCTPPHDISDRPFAEHLPQGPRHAEVMRLMEDSRLLLEGHEVNRERRREGKTPANMIWLWGQGKKPRMPTLTERYRITGGVISAVDLVKGLGIYAGLSVIPVPGATGYLDTNYVGKAEAALKVLKKHDFVFVHVEAPDEAGHNGDPAAKVQAIEDFDAKVVGTILKGLEGREDFRILLLPDHPTPLDVRTHVDEPVPFVLYQPGVPGSGAAGYDEVQARAAGRHVEEAWRLMDVLLTGQWPEEKAQTATTEGTEEKTTTEGTESSGS
jgi:2,3-bisphosphoglycerate-independent phosphoglycerate mutase